MAATDTSPLDCALSTNLQLDMVQVKLSLHTEITPPPPKKEKILIKTAV